MWTRRFKSYNRTRDSRAIFSARVSHVTAVSNVLLSVLSGDMRFHRQLVAVEDLLCSGHVFFSEEGNLACPVIDIPVSLQEQFALNIAWFDPLTMQVSTTVGRLPARGLASTSIFLLSSLCFCSVFLTQTTVQT